MSLIALPLLPCAPGTSVPEIAIMAEGAPIRLDGSQLIMLAGIVLLTMFSLIATRKRMRNRIAADESTARERYTELSRKHEAQDHAGQAMLELDRVAREIHLQLDLKFAKLEVLTRHADERIARLAALSPPDGEANDASAVPSARLAPVPGKGAAGPQAAGGTPRADTASTPHAPEASHDDRSGTHLREQVCALMQSGTPVEEIARLTSTTVSEVRLILSLHKAQEKRRRESTLSR